MLNFCTVQNSQSDCQGLYNWTKICQCSDYDFILKYVQCITILNNRRPLLQRQQRQSSEETEVSSLRGSVHFKEDPEYFENAAASKAIVATTNSINALTSSAQSDLCLGEEKIYEQIRGMLNVFFYGCYLLIYSRILLVYFQNHPKEWSVQL